MSKIINPSSGDKRALILHIVLPMSPVSVIGFFIDGQDHKEEYRKTDFVAANSTQGQG